MPTRLLLEGPDIEGLLARIRDEHGSRARIVQADRVRTGGIAGFFAKQRYEVAVELPNDDDAPTSASTAGPTRTAASVGSMTVPHDILGLVDDIDSLERVAPEQAMHVTVPADATPQLSTTTDDFARVLARLTQDVADPAQPPSVSLVVTPFTPARIPSPRQMPDGPESAPFERMSFSNVNDLPSVAVPKPETPVASGLSLIESLAMKTLAEESQSLFDSLRYEPVVDEASPVVEFRHSSTPVAFAPVPAAPEDLGRYIASPLRALGVPEELAPAVPASEAVNTHLALARMIAALPEAPRPLKGAGQITVVVGDGAYAAARDVARRARLDPEAVLLAAPGASASGMHSRRDIAGPVHARRRAPGLRESDSAVVVALDVPPGRENLEWARSVIRELAPDAVWALVDATRKSADVAQLLRRLGHVDALVVERTEETADPASVLGLGVPIAQLDGRRASGAAWSALLGARLAEEDEL